MEHGVPSKKATRLTAAETFAGNVEMDPKAHGVGARKGTDVSYYRPSGTKGFWFYAGLVQEVWLVQFPSGKKSHVVALN